MLIRHLAFEMKTCSDDNIRGLISKALFFGMIFFKAPGCLKDDFLV